MKGLYLLLCISLAFFVPSAGFAQGTEALEPAEYKAPEIGTRIEYSKWACTVEEVDGFRTKCRLDEEGGSVTLFAWMQVEGKMPRSGYFADRSLLFRACCSGTTRFPVRKASFEEDDLEAIASLWPMEVGKDVQFTDKFRNNGRVFSTASVESTELVEVDGSRLRAFVIKVQGRIRLDRLDQTEFMRRLWYSPDLGIVVKEEFEWTKGERKGRRFDYVLKSARLADGRSLLGSSPAKPPTQVASVPERPAAPVTQPPKPEVNRDALLAAGEYVAPEVGTRIEYAGWTCTVEEVDGFRTKCRLDEGGKITLFGWLEIDGNYPRTSYFANRYKIGSVYNVNRFRLRRSQIAEKDRRAIESLWPLEVGKEVRYSTKAEVAYGSRNQGSGSEFGRVSSTATVESSGLAIVGGRDLQTFVITVQSKLRISLFNGIWFYRSEYTRRLWYAPELGLIIKEEFTFGAGKGKRLESILRSIRLSDGTRIFPPPAATPVASVETGSIEERLESVQDLLEQGLITKEEAAEKRQEIVDEL